LGEFSHSPILLDSFKTLSNHSAVFPDDLPEWFIKLFTKKGDCVLDPFMGSGTTVFVAQRMERNAVGIEILPEYFESVYKKVKPIVEMHPTQMALLEKKGKYATNKPK
jgi:DNA modification methylase